MSLPRLRLRGVTPVRFSLGVFVIAAWCLSMALLTRLDSPLLTLLAGALFTVPLCSLGEWLIHGVLYHSALPKLEFIQEIHHKGHHFTLFPPTHYVQEGDKFEFMRFRKPYKPFQMADNPVDNALTSWSQVALHFVTGIPLIIAPAWLVSHDALFTASATATLGLISWLLAAVHGAIHTPRDRWIERQDWFKWLDRHHYIHHIDITANINFMLPLCDLLFGTQKWELTSKEAAGYPAFEDAKRGPRSGHSLPRGAAPRPRFVRADR